jgi:F420-non-reducing hydrogenase iron-sulfur subunit
MCSGRVDPLFVLKAFEEGADGVLIAGCHPGDCHYQSGNYKTQRRIHVMKRMLEQYGINPDRLRLEWVSAAESTRFAHVVDDMTKTIRALGPSPLGGGDRHE